MILLRDAFPPRLRCSIPLRGGHFDWRSLRLSSAATCAGSSDVLDRHCWIGDMGRGQVGFFDNVQILQRWFGSTPMRDTPVSHAIAYVCYRDWDHRFSDAAGSKEVDAVAALQEFQQAAADDRVTIWGKVGQAENPQGA